MKEIKIVFKPYKNSDEETGHFDIYIDGVRENLVKRFHIDISNDLPKNEFTIDRDLSYGIEHYIDLIEVYNDDHLID